MLLRAATPVIALFFVSLLALSFSFAQLRRPEKPGNRTIRMTGWGAPEEEAILRQALGEFEKRNPDLHVEFVQIPGLGYDYLNKVRLMLVAGIGPDVFYVPDGNFGELASRGTLLPLDPYLSQINVVEMWKSGVDRYRWDGHVLGQGTLYCIPKDVGPNAMFYNKALFQKHAIPFPPHDRALGYDEAIAMWKKLSYRTGGLAHYGLSGFPYEAAVWSSGAEILSADRRTLLLEEPKAATAMQWVADLGTVHGVLPIGGTSSAGSTLDPTQLFESELAATHIDGRWKVPRFRKLPFDWDIAPIPAPQPGGKSITWSGSVGLGIPTSSRRPEDAFRLIAFLTGPDGQSILTSTGLQIPNQPSLATTAVYMQPGQKPAHPEVFLEAARTGRPGPWAATPNTFWHDVLWNNIGPIWRGQERAQEHMRKITPLINRTLREYNPQ